MSWPVRHNPRPHPAPALRHRRVPTRSDAYQLQLRSSPRRNARPEPSGHPARARTRSTEDTASGSVVSGFCTAVALNPAACSRAITSDQHDPSANSPCARTTLRAFTVPEGAAMLRVERREVAAPATMAAEKLRLVIIMRWLPSASNSLKAGVQRVSSVAASAFPALQLAFLESACVCRIYDVPVMCILDGKFFVALPATSCRSEPMAVRAEAGTPFGARNFGKAIGCVNPEIARWHHAGDRGGRRRNGIWRTPSTYAERCHSAASFH